MKYNVQLAYLLLPADYPDVVKEKTFNNMAEAEAFGEHWVKNGYTGKPDDSRSYCIKEVSDKTAHIAQR